MDLTVEELASVMQNLGMSSEDADAYLGIVQANLGVAAMVDAIPAYQPANMPVATLLPGDNADPRTVVEAAFSPLANTSAFYSIIRRSQFQPEKPAACR